MTTALLIIAAVLVIAAFVGGIAVGRKTIATPSNADVPPPTSADADAAEAKATEDAKTKAAEVGKMTDAQVADRVAQLRARGRAGE